MRNTPETDARAWSDHSEGILHEVVEASFARKLERERDEARKELKHITEYGTEEINAAVELRQRLASALVERDEAREVFREMWQSGDAFLPYIDKETTSRWRKTAGWDEAK
jgi:hypothetical protein